jgi:hypothetical protein
MVFETKVAILVLEDLPVWQKLNVAAFLATGVAGAAPEAMGEPYVDAAGREHARLLGQPMLVFAATPDGLLRAYRAGIERGLAPMLFTLAHTVHLASFAEGARRVFWVFVPVAAI